MLENISLVISESVWLKLTKCHKLDGSLPTLLSRKKSQER